MYATARIVLQAADKALTLPREAVATRDGQRVVFKIDGDKVTPVAVVEGLNDGRRVQIAVGSRGRRSGARRRTAAAAGRMRESKRFWSTNAVVDGPRSTVCGKNVPVNRRP